MLLLRVVVGIVESLSGVVSAAVVVDDGGNAGVPVIDSSFTCCAVDKVDALTQGVAVVTRVPPMVSVEQ